MTTTTDAAAHDDIERTLTEITQDAVGQRELRLQARPKLIMSAAVLAQKIAAQLHAANLHGDDLRVLDEDGGQRIYRIREICWKTGPLWRREIRRPLTMFLVVSGLDYRLLWNPYRPDETWDAKRVPEVYIGDLSLSGWHKNHLASSAIMAQFAKDAQALLQGVRDRERHRTEHLLDGLAASEANLTNVL